MVNDRQDRLGGQVGIISMLSEGLSPLTLPNPHTKLDHTNSSPAASKGAGGVIKPSEVVRQGGTTRDRPQAARHSHHCSRDGSQGLFTWVCEVFQRQRRKH